MLVTVCSVFRTATSYIPRYFKQMAELQTLLNTNGYDLTLCLGYGDSRDKTGEMLFEEASNRFSAVLLEYNHGGPHFGPVVNAQRFEQLSKVGNHVLRSIDPATDYLIWVEADIVWHANVLHKLVKRLDEVPAVCPLILERGGHLSMHFYDTWAFRRYGVPFVKKFPYHQDFMERMGDLMLIDSGGSCMAMRGDVAKAVHFPPEDVFVGLSKQIWDVAGSLWIDTNLMVMHP